MLYLTRKIGESIIVNDIIEIMVVKVKGNTVKLGIVCPNTETILRKELHDKITKENLSASQVSSGEIDALKHLFGKKD